MNKKYVIYAEKSFVWIKMIKVILIEKRLKSFGHYTGKFRGAAHSKCNLNYKVQKEIPIIIHNASYDTHFILNQLVIEIKGEPNCIGDNMEKYVTFSVPIKKECDNNETVTYKLKFIDSFRFTPDSLSNRADNTSGIFNITECNSCIEKTKINSDCCFVGLKNNRVIYKCK